MSKVVVTIGGALWMRNLAKELYEKLGYEVVGVVVEETYSLKNKYRQLRKRLLKYGFCKTFDQILLQVYLGFSKLEYGELESFPEFSCPQIQCENINDQITHDFIESLTPDFVVNLGGGLMKPNIFEIANVCTINVHPGITPRFRGANANFWALYEGEFDKVGVTVHKVDKGIDTGEVLCQRFLSIQLGVDSLEKVTLRAYREGLDCVCQIINHFDDSGNLIVQPEMDIIAKTYGWYGLSHYIKVRRKLACRN